MQAIFLIALLVSFSTASLLNRALSKECKNHPNSAECESTYLDSVCMPGSNSKDVNLDFPCNQALYIGVECVYGSKPNITNDGIDISLDAPTLSNSTQRLCICESQYFETNIGCISCFTKHGGEGEFGVFRPNVISSMSSAYCAASATPTLGIFEYQFQYLNKPQFSTLFPSSSSSGSRTSTFSDPLADSTAVSLYYTAAVTGTDAVDVGAFTATGTALQTTISIRDGYIVATASTNANTAPTTSTATTGATQGGASPSDSTTSTSGIGSRHTEAAFAGVLGMIGAIALL